jgi:sugar O-acyltransferase (sialic acid O-acetyltransferase NeuD family)
MKLIIVGAGGHGQVIADTAEKTLKWTSISFVDDMYPSKTIIGNWEVIGKIKDLAKFQKEYDSIIVAIGDNKLRMDIMISLKELNLDIVSIIHPSAQIAKNVEIAKGTVIFANSVLNYGVKIHKGCIINTSSSIDHGSIIKSFAHISPGANLGGDVIIGERSWVGIGATIIHSCNVSDDVIIGAGAVVINDIKNASTVYGVPAR